MLCSTERGKTHRFVYHVYNALWYSIQSDILARLEGYFLISDRSILTAGNPFFILMNVIINQPLCTVLLSSYFADSYRHS